MKKHCGKVLVVVGLSIIWTVIPMDETASEGYKLMMVVPTASSLGKIGFGGRVFYGDKSALHEKRGNFSICLSPWRHITFRPIKNYEDFWFCAVCPQDRMYKPIKDHEELKAIVQKERKNVKIQHGTSRPKVFRSSFLFLAIQEKLDHEALKNEQNNYYSINGCDDQGRTALHWLVRHPEATKEDVDALLKQGAKLLASTNIKIVYGHLVFGNDIYYDGIKCIGGTPNENDEPFKVEDQYYGKREVMNYAFSLILCKKIQKLFWDELYEKLQKLQKQ